MHPVQALARILLIAQGRYVDDLPDSDLTEAEREVRRLAKEHHRLTREVAALREKYIGKS